MSSCFRLCTVGSLYNLWDSQQCIRRSVTRWWNLQVPDGLGAVSIRKTILPGMAIPMLKIRRPNGRLIFNMGIPIPGKTVFYIETGPWSSNELQWLEFKKRIPVVVPVADPAENEGTFTLCHTLGQEGSSKQFIYVLTEPCFNPPGPTVASNYLQGPHRESPKAMSKLSDTLIDSHLGLRRYQSRKNDHI